VGSSPTGGMDVYLLWVLCVVRQSFMRQADHSSRGVLPTVVRRCVWSRNFVNEEATARVGSQRHNKKAALFDYFTTLNNRKSCSQFKDTRTVTMYSQCLMRKHLPTPNTGVTSPHNLHCRRNVYGLVLFEIYENVWGNKKLTQNFVVKSYSRTLFPNPW